MTYSRQGPGLCPQSPERILSVANKEDVNVNEKIHPRPTEEISAPHAEGKYVLEDVFWVPLSNTVVDNWVLCENKQRKEQIVET
jgi:hypothetical protein